MDKVDMTKVTAAPGREGLFDCVEFRNQKGDRLFFIIEPDGPYRAAERAAAMNRDLIPYMGAGTEVWVC